MGEPEDGFAPAKKLTGPIVPAFKRDTRKAGPSVYRKMMLPPLTEPKAWEWLPRPFDADIGHCAGRGPGCQPPSLAVQAGPHSRRYCTMRGA